MLVAGTCCSLLLTSIAFVRPFFEGRLYDAVSLNPPVRLVETSACHLAEGAGSRWGGGSEVGAGGEVVA